MARAVTTRASARCRKPVAGGPGRSVRSPSAAATARTSASISSKVRA